MAPRDKFDVDKFIDELEAQEEFEIDDEPRFTACPRCGSDTWDKLFYTKKCKPSHCNECKDEHEQ